MTAIVLPDSLELSSTATRALRGAARFWLAAAVVGQWIFLYYIAMVYGGSSLTGNFAAWAKNTFLIRGYVPHDTAGNLAFAAHALLAGVTSFGGAVQLIPWIRQRAIAVHRWNGRLFFVTAIGVSVSGLYMVWFRGARLDLASAIAISINATLIIVFSVMAWRTAMRREVATHRKWALAAYLVANGQWFFRVGMFAWILVNRGPVGITKGLGGPFPFVWSFGCYLLPLGVLALYLRAANAAPRARLAMAGGLVVLTILMSIGIFGITLAMWAPVLRRL
jgi:hypothetical protein